tara:strand:+ start:292 stop:570 length:279 start_codon:yes stop_codon:yes gene_type:complete
MRLEDLPKERISQLSKDKGLELLKKHRTMAIILRKKTHKTGPSKKPKIIDKGLEEEEVLLVKSILPSGEVEKIKKIRKSKRKKKLKCLKIKK